MVGHSEVIAQSVLGRLGDMPPISVIGRVIPLVDGGEVAGPESATTRMLLRYLQQNATWSPFRESHFVTFMHTELRREKEAAQKRCEQAVRPNRKIRVFLRLLVGWPGSHLLTRILERVLQSEELPTFPTPAELLTGLTSLREGKFIRSFAESGEWFLAPNPEFVERVVAHILAHG